MLKIVKASETEHGKLLDTDFLCVLDESKRILYMSADREDCARFINQRRNRVEQGVGEG